MDYPGQARRKHQGNPWENHIDLYELHKASILRAWWLSKPTNQSQRNQRYCLWANSTNRAKWWDISANILGHLTLPGVLDKEYQWKLRAWMWQCVQSVQRNQVNQRQSAWQIAHNLTKSPCAICKEILELRLKYRFRWDC